MSNKYHNAHNPTIEDVQWIVDNHQCRTFTWGSDEADYEPLLLDVFSAKVLMSCYCALEKSKTIDKFKRFITRDRNHFCYLVDFCFKHIDTKGEE